MESLTLYTKWGQAPEHGEMQDLRWKIRRFVQNIKTNGFPLWYKKATPITLDLEFEKDRYEHDQMVRCEEYSLIQD